MLRGDNSGNPPNIEGTKVPCIINANSSAPNASYLNQRVKFKVQNFMAHFVFFFVLKHNRTWIYQCSSLFISEI